MRQKPGSACVCAGGHAGGAGTLGYVAAEAQSSGSGFSFKSDMFALGVVVYELMVLHQHPFDDESEAGIIRNIEVGLFPPVPSSKFSDELKNLTYKLLNRHPAQRPATADVFGLALVRSVAERLEFDLPIVEGHTIDRFFDQPWAGRFGTPPKQRPSALTTSKPNWVKPGVNRKAPTTVDQLLHAAEHGTNNNSKSSTECSTRANATSFRMNAAASTNRATAADSFALPAAPVAPGFRAARPFKLKAKNNNTPSVAKVPSTTKSNKIKRGVTVAKPKTTVRNTMVRGKGAPKITFGKLEL